MFRLQGLETTMLVFGQPCTVSWSSILKWYDRCHASTMNYNVEIINSCGYADNSASIRIHGPKGGAVPWSAGTRASGSALPTIARGWREDRAAQIPARTADRLSAAHPGQARRPGRQGRGGPSRTAPDHRASGRGQEGHRLRESRPATGGVPPHLAAWEPALDRCRPTARLRCGS